MTERSFVMVKPDGVAAGLTGEIISRIERRGLAILAVRKAVMARDVAEVHYGEHSERPFFGELVEFITSGPVVMMAVEGEGAVGALRQAGVASQDDVRDLDLRLTEVEVRMRLLDGAAEAPAAAPDDGALQRRREPERKLPETAGGRTGDTGRSARWRRGRREPEAYD